MITSLFETVLAQAPPVQCGLYNAVSGGGVNTIIGNLRGLENLVVPILAALLAVLLVFAIVPRLRSMFLTAVFWVAGIGIGGAIVVAAIAAIAPSSC